MDHFTEWAESAGTMTAKMVHFFLTSGKVAEQGYKSCVSLMKPAERYGDVRTESICNRILVYSSMPSVRKISSIMRNRQDKAHSKKEAPAVSSSYGIIRGAAYCCKGDEQK